MASFEGRSDRVPPRLAGVARWAPTDDHRERAARRLSRGDAATPWRSPDRRPDEAASVRGRPLTATEAGVLGPGFDFSNLRIVADHEARGAARAADARAFTVGRQIVWGLGAAPDSARGRPTLAQVFPGVGLSFEFGR